MPSARLQPSSSLLGLSSMETTQSASGLGKEASRAEETDLIKHLAEQVL